MRILVCGDRNWTDKEMIAKKMDLVAKKERPTIIMGAARGADQFAGEVAMESKWPLECFPANWKKYGKAAGPIRNKQMLDKGKPDLVLAFHDDLQNSKGTKDMVARAEKAGIKVIKISHRGKQND